MKPQIALIFLFLLFAKVEGTAVRKPSKCNDYAGKSDPSVTSDPSCKGCLTTVHPDPGGEEFTTVGGQKKTWKKCQWNPNAKGAKRCRMVILNEGGGQEGYIEDEDQCPEVLEEAKKAKARDSIGKLLRRPGAHNPKALVKHSSLAAPSLPGPWGSGDSGFVYRTRRMQELMRNDGYCWRYAASQTFGFPFAVFNQLTQSMINSDKKNALYTKLAQSMINSDTRNAAEKSKKQSPSYKSYDSQIPTLKSMWGNMNKPQQLRRSLIQPVHHEHHGGQTFDFEMALGSRQVVEQIEQDVNIAFNFSGSDVEGKHAVAARLACTRLSSADKVDHLHLMGEKAPAFLKSTESKTPFLERRVLMYEYDKSTKSAHVGVLKLCKEDEEKLCYVDANNENSNDGQEIPWSETPYAIGMNKVSEYAGWYLKVEWNHHCDKAYMAWQKRIEAVLAATTPAEANQKMAAIQPGDKAFSPLFKYFSYAWKAIVEHSKSLNAKHQRKP